MSINSHVQLNKAIMERFSFKAIDPESGAHKSKVATVYYLDINEKEIKTQKIKKLGTKFGYFTDDEENMLGNIEAEFGQIAQAFESWEPGSNFNLIHYEDKIKEFANLLIARSELRRQQIQQLANHIFVEKYKGEMELLVKHPITITPQVFFKENHGVTLLINESTKNFVIPRNGLVFCPNDRGDCYVFPISPKRAIMLYPMNFFKPQELGNSPIAIACVRDESSVSAFNNSALLTEKAIDNTFVISKTKEELEELWVFVKSDEWELYKSR